MKTSRQPQHRCFMVTVALGAGVLLVPGCALLPPVRQSAAPNQTEAVLAAARAKEITIFGDVPARAPARYQTLTATGLRQHTFAEEGTDFDPDIERTGRRMVFASTRHHLRPDLYLKAVEGVAVTQLTADPAGDIQPRFSPDGTRIAFASDRGGSWDIWIIDLKGGQPVQVTHGPADEIHPSWSPDGNRLIYSSLPAGSGQWELWITDAMADGKRKFVGYGLFPEWSPVNQTILFQRARERGSHWFSVWALTLVDDEPHYPVELASGSQQAMILPTWNADGTQIAFAAVSTGVPGPGMEQAGSPVSGADSDVWLMQADGRGRLCLTDGHSANYAPTFSPDGRVFFTSDRATGRETIWSLRPMEGALELSPTEVRTTNTATPSSAASVAEASTEPSLLSVEP